MPFVVAAILASFACAASAQLWSFNGADGSEPLTGLIADAEGNFYGTTCGGGVHDQGVVFKLSQEPGGSWSEDAIYSFGDNPGDGSCPGYDLTLDREGNLYGLAAGVYFKLTPEKNGRWTEEPIYNFPGPAHDFGSPYGGLTVDEKGNLYGVVSGAIDDMTGYVYQLSRNTDGKWVMNIIYRFNVLGSGDGAEPQGTLIWDESGNLYGTTSAGGEKTGACNCLPIGKGTVFELTPGHRGAWSEKVLYSFQGGPGDGAGPVGSLVFDSKGDLYGATTNGGAADGGTVFELARTSGGWNEKVLHDVFSIEDNESSISPYSGPVFDQIGNLYLVTFGTIGIPRAVIQLRPEPSGDWTESIAFKLLEFNGVISSLSDLLFKDGNLYFTTSRFGADNDGTVSEIASPAAAPAPTFSKGTGTYDAPVEVKIVDALSDATVHFTTDGKSPTTSSPKYTGPVRVAMDETITAIATARGYTDSGAISATYKIRTAKPEFSIAAGKYSKPQTVKITDSARDAVIHYTTNGADPTVSSKEYTTPIEVSSTETIKAIAIVANHVKSLTASATYTIKKSEIDGRKERAVAR
jgi:uncharacterized repeat protein (TIGR03803 family)